MKKGIVDCTIHGFTKRKNARGCTACTIGLKPHHTPLATRTCCHRPGAEPPPRVALSARSYACSAVIGPARARVAPTALHRCMLDSHPPAAPAAPLAPARVPSTTGAALLVFRAGATARARRAAAGPAWPHLVGPRTIAPPKPGRTRWTLRLCQLPKVAPHAIAPQGRPHRCIAHTRSHRCTSHPLRHHNGRPCTCAGAFAPLLRPPARRPLATDTRADRPVLCTLRAPPVLEPPPP